MFVILILAAWLAAAQEVELTAPWLTVYDPEGQPRWEISLRRLVKTDEGWQGEEVLVRLFRDGELQFSLTALEISADRLGQSWILTGEVRGEAEGLTFTCGRAIWEQGLRLEEVEAVGEEFSLVAEEARWDQGEEIVITGGVIRSRGWELEFSQGTYSLSSGLLAGGEVRLSGHGYEIEAQGFTLLPREERLELRGARVVPRA